MHPSTKQSLAQLTSWIADVAIADRFAVALQTGITEPIDGQPWAQVCGTFGDLTLSLYEAESVNDITPYLHHVRTVGFERQGEAREDSDAGTVVWQYSAKIDGEETRRRQKLVVTLHLKTETASCRYVKVGMKEVPNMKLMCGEELTAWDEAQKSETVSPQ